jgi:MYXO-CTERM domain-containing protein
MFQNRSINLIAAAAASGLVGAASADVVISLTSQTFNAFEFALAQPAGSLSGILTGATIDVTLENSVAYTYADDLCLYLDSGDLGFNGALQIGGYHTLFATQRYFWPNGNSNKLGTMSAGAVEIAVPIDFDGSDLNVWIGNGYSYPGSSGTWSGTVTLHGVSVIPTPGSIALLGLSALAARRRR